MAAIESCVSSPVVKVVTRGVGLVCGARCDPTQPCRELDGVIVADVDPRVDDGAPMLVRLRTCGRQMVLPRSCSCRTRRRYGSRPIDSRLGGTLSE